jgi:hypothetical protein
MSLLLNIGRLLVNPTRPPVDKKQLLVRSGRQFENIKPDAARPTDAASIR